MLIDQVPIDIEEAEVKVVGSVREEGEGQSSQPPHKKQKKSHMDQVDPKRVVVSTRSVQVAAQAHDTRQKVSIITITTIVSVKKKTYD
jgi:hypothetical protein